MELLQRVDALGGAAQAIAAAFFQEEIGRSAYEHQMSVERGDTVIVGVNRFADDGEIPAAPTPDYSRLEREQISRLREIRAKRDQTRAATALENLDRIAERFGAKGELRNASLVPAIVEAVRARASVGEIATVLRSRWGVYRPGMSHEASRRSV